MDLLIFATLILCTLALLWSYRRPRLRKTAASVATAPSPMLDAAPRITHPRRAQRSDVTVWVLRASPHCELTRAFLHNRRYRTEDAVPLPAVGCSLGQCQCRYEPVRDTRRGERRREANRRHAFRLESGADRRTQRDRRVQDLWSNTQLR